MSPAERTIAATPMARSGVLLLLGTLLSNALAYAFLLLLTRHLSPDGFGAVGSLVNLTAICIVPALGLQLVAARLVTRAAHESDRAGDSQLPGVDARVMRLAWELGGGVTLVLVLGSPMIAALLHLDVVAVIVLAAGMVPVALTYAVQGVLQGEEKFGRLALVLALTGLMKFAAGAVSVVVGLDVLGVVALLSAGWVITAAAALLLLPPHRRVPARRFSRSLIRMVATAAIPTSGLLFLSSIDVLLARHHLPLHESGAYTVGAIFEKVAFWGMSFLATLFYPRMARPMERRQAILVAAGVTLGIGAVGVIGSALLGDLLASVAGGAAYSGLGSLVWRFTALGVCLAFVQVLVYAGLAAARSWMGGAVWATAVVALLVVGLHHESVESVVTAMLWCVAVLAVVLAVVTAAIELRATAPVSARRRARSDRPRR